MQQKKINPNRHIRVSSLGERGLLIESARERADHITQHIFWQIDGISMGWPGFKETVPGASGLVIVFDTVGNRLQGHDRLLVIWDECLRHAQERQVAEIIIDVRYGGGAGPDLPWIAAEAALSVQEWVAQHVADSYTVASLGAHPGVLYLDGLADGVLRFPASVSPPSRIAPGAIAVNGLQTSIAAATLPFGWAVIGQAGMPRFAFSGEPALLQPGDRVKFSSLDSAT
ncbi:carboxyltransferase domain-containing protein [Pseudomonas sp. ChxA]|uniref:carboxyltransferase domain-containing protein n=1 Tax=unclassified Pseudomonas TaxID=196821 RepID=UPI000A78B5F3|nr:carboxyltransferase domain-containing protein [Pseudomonas sp. ChxA]MDL2186904.1 carboxyltransferase domain-containing protein [Pseudomonas sp. ChxA]